MTTLANAPTRRPEPAAPPEHLAFLRRLGDARPAAIVALSVALIALVGLFDYIFGTDISVTLFYLVPIALLAWYLGWRWGAAGGVVCSAVWLIANIASGLHYPNPAIYVWNSLMRLGTFEVVAYLFSELRLVLQHEQQLARTDFVTGAINSRAFYEALQLEIARGNRYGHALTLAYVDLDNFKSVNDQLGHSAGDAVLRTLVATARGIMRASDLVARVGGDEFVLLLPETGAAEARGALDKIHRALLDAMRAHNWPVTVSVGVLVCAGPIPSADNLVRAADDLMYTVKHAGKNDVRFSELAPSTAAPAPAPPATTATAAAPG